MANNNLDQDDPKLYHQNVYNNVIENIENALYANELTEEEAEAYKLQALGDLQVRLLVEDGYDEEEAVAYVFGEDAFEDDSVETEESEPVYYSGNNMANAEFNEENLNNFAIALAELIEEEYETAEDGILTLADVTGYEPEEVVNLLTGEGVPTEELVDEIASCFDTVIGDEDTYVALHLLAAEARGEDVSLEEETGEEYYEDDVIPENQYNPELDAAYSEVEQLKNRVAEFEAGRMLKTRLDKLVRKAEGLMADFRLFPVEFTALFGSLPDALDDEKIAMFTTLCEKERVSIETELFAINKFMEIAERRGQVMPNGRIVNNDEFTTKQTEAAEFAAEVEEQAKRNLELYKKSSHSVNLG